MLSNLINKNEIKEESFESQIIETPASDKDSSGSSKHECSYDPESQVQLANGYRINQHIIEN